ncbi:MAG: hypothetical protein IIA67_11750, partial [Planctomycetes bacterium]|nr:hypothetical protein [Planctomycetota bacterium]
MATVRFTGEILPDGTIRLPEGVKLTPGKAEITVEPASDALSQHGPQRRSLADWAETEAEHWGRRLRAD